MEENNKVSKKVLIGIAVASVFIVCLVAVTLYLYFNAPKKVKKDNLDGADLKLTYTDEDKGLTINNLTLFDDAHGTKIDDANYYFDFSVGAKLNEASKLDYEISVIANKTTTIPVKYIKVYLEKLNSGTFTQVAAPKILTISKKQSDLGSKLGSMVLAKESTKKSTSNNYRLRAWVDSSSNYQIQPTDTISLEVEVHGKAS